MDVARPNLKYWRGAPAEEGAVNRFQSLNTNITSCVPSVYFNSVWSSCWFVIFTTHKWNEYWRRKWWSNDSI